MDRPGRTSALASDVILVTGAAQLDRAAHPEGLLGGASTTPRPSDEKGIAPAVVTVGR